MKKIKILSSSYLLPNHKFWKRIKKNYELDFCDFGDFSSLSKCREDETLFLVLFFEDFNFSESKAKKNIEQILLDIKSKFLNFKSKLIISFSYSQDFSPYISLNKETKKDKIYYKMKSKIRNLTDHLENIFFLDIEKTFSNFGYKNCLDFRNWYLFRSRLSNFGLNLLITEINLCLDILNSVSKKVLILDCDNTLWGGVLGEDGVEGIELGTDGIGLAFYDFQKKILDLEKRGIIICLCSKNNHDDVIQVIKSHPFMLLREKHLTELSINWNSKYINIIELSKKMNLGLDSFVFWDDNPIEREEVKNNLPEVSVIDVPENVEEWSEILSSSKMFINLNPTTEDKNKTKQYKVRKKFMNDLEKEENNKLFIKNIKGKPLVVTVDDFSLKRASQMTIKTNQFNFRTKRFLPQELKSFNKNKGNKSFIVSFDDKYGSHGFVGLIMTSELDEKSLFIENFLMSCRILGRNLELWFLSYICDLFKKEKKEFLVLEYLESKKNKLLIDFIYKNFKKKINSNNTRIIISINEFSKIHKDVF